jgi:hypothetical protein
LTQGSAYPAQGSRADTASDQGPARIVFVAGISFSGSTLMGLMLGSRPNAIFGGELKDYKRRMQSEIRKSGSFCSCGKSRESCPFWSEVQTRYGRETELSPAPGFSWQNLVLGIKVLLGVGLKDREVTPHGSLLKSIYEVAQVQYPGIDYVVDTSKSISNLDAIARMPGIEVSVIHLIRNGLAVGGSYQKRKSGLLYGMATWCIGNLFIRLYIKRRGLRSVTVDYGSLCVGEESTYRKLNDFLGTDLRLETATDDIRNTTYHIVSGNGKVRRSAADFQGIHYTESPLKGNRFEQWIADTFVQPLNRSFGVTLQTEERQ